MSEEVKLTFRPGKKLTLSDLLKNLDESLEQNDLVETRKLIDRWNIQQAKAETNPLSDAAEELGLNFVADIVRDKGLRLPSLEEALKVGRVTLSGSVRLDREFLKALRGQKSLTVERWALKLKIRF